MPLLLAILSGGEAPAIRAKANRAVGTGRPFGPPINLRRFAARSLHEDANQGVLPGVVTNHAVRAQPQTEPSKLQECLLVGSQLEFAQLLR